jgi:CDP-glucose 4,6-dehydratase
MSICPSNIANFWYNKNVLLTGHTGFKGGWLAIFLQRMGAKVSGIALPPSTNPNLFELARVAESMDSHYCDIRDAQHFKRLVQGCRPEIVIHLAAQSLVRKSYSDPVGTFNSNVMGTVHLLDALRGLSSARVALMITTDKVYQSNENAYPYRETDQLGGHDPYSASKAASELVIASYKDVFLKAEGVSVATARAGNVIGGGDWSEDRLIPDAIRAWQSSKVLDIRRPQAIRPWQHVLEPLKGYLILAEALWLQPELAGAWNFGPNPHQAATVREVIEIAKKHYGCGEVQYGEGSDGPYEASWLALETAKARVSLGLKPRWELKETVTRTIDWYRAQKQGADARELCAKEIDEVIKN